MNQLNTIITIGREFGSGGHAIGEALAKQYNVPLYDKEMLTRAAKESGICKELFEAHDEKPTNSFLYSLVMDSYSFGMSSGVYADMPLNQKLFLAQYEAIKNIAKEGPCILVGRCADYVLDDMKNCFNIFVTANVEDRIQKVAAMYELPYQAAKEKVLKTDKRRSSYYNYYTNKKWGDLRSYDLCLSTSKLGLEGAVQTITQAITIFEKI